MTWSHHGETTFTRSRAQKLDWLDDVVRARRPERLPVVLTRAEVRTIPDQITGVNGLIANLLYGTGLRKMECLRLPVTDIDFDYSQIHVRCGKGETAFFLSAVSQQLSY